MTEERLAGYRVNGTFAWKGQPVILAVAFAGSAFTQAPLTLDYGVIQSLMAELDVSMIEDGTAVGMGLATAVKRLEASEAASKVVILLTDGRSNRGEIGPATAAPDRALSAGARNRGSNSPRMNAFSLRFPHTTSSVCEGFLNSTTSSPSCDCMNCCTFSMRSRGCSVSRLYAARSNSWRIAWIDSPAVNAAKSSSLPHVFGGNSARDEK